MRIQTAKGEDISSVVGIHLATFPGFFLTFLGPGFLKVLYQGFLEHYNSELLVARQETDGAIMGFAAYSNNISQLYRYLLRHHTLSLGWYAFLGFLRRPSVFFRLLRALKQPGDCQRAEAYATLSSIGTYPDHKRKGVGSALLDAIKQQVDFSQVAYLMLQTDAKDNEAVNAFYISNGFVLHGCHTTREGRKMNEYRFRPDLAKGQAR